MIDVLIYCARRPTLTEQVSRCSTGQSTPSLGAEKRLDEYNSQGILHSVYVPLLRRSLKLLTSAHKSQRSTAQKAC